MSVECVKIILGQVILSKEGLKTLLQNTKLLATLKTFERKDVLKKMS